MKQILPARITQLAARLGPLTAIAILAFTGPVMASDSQGRFVARGVGNATCEAYLAGLSQPATSGPYVSWLLGYATAANRIYAQTFDLLPTVDALDLPRLVAVVCQADPALTLATATERTLATLRPLRQATETPLVTLSHQGRTMAVRQGALQMLAVGLTAKQLYRGPTTGQPNADLYKAIKALQEREKLAVTGLPDIDTFIRAVIKN